MPQACILTRISCEPSGTFSKFFISIIELVFTIAAFMLSPLIIIICKYGNISEIYTEI